MGVAGTDVPALHNFLKILSGNGPEYGSEDTGYFSPSCECFFVSDGVAAALELTPPDLSSTSHAAYLKEKAARLQSRHVDLETAEAELERRREELEQQ